MPKFVHLVSTESHSILRSDDDSGRYRQRHGSNRQPMTFDLARAAYAASRISSNLKGSTKQFGWSRQPTLTDLLGLAGLHHLSPRPSKDLNFHSRNHTDNE